MEEIFKKKVTRKEFLKTCAILTAAGLISLTSFNFLKPKDKKIGYGTGKYGG